MRSETQTTGLIAFRFVYRLSNAVLLELPCIIPKNDTKINHMTKEYWTAILFRIVIK